MAQGRANHFRAPDRGYPHCRATRFRAQAGTRVLFEHTVRIAGALLLLYLAWRLWQQIRAGIHVEQSETSTNAPRGLRWGVLMLFLSLGPYLFWSLINGPILLSALELSIWHAVAFLAAFYLVSIGGLIALAYLLSRLGDLSERVHRSLQFFSLFLMLAIAAFLLRQGLTV